MELIDKNKLMITWFLVSAYFLPWYCVAFHLTCFTKPYMIFQCFYDFVIRHSVNTPADLRWWDLILIPTKGWSICRKLQALTSNNLICVCMHSTARDQFKLWSNRVLAGVNIYLLCKLTLRWSSLIHQYRSSNIKVDRCKWLQSCHTDISHKPYLKYVIKWAKNQRLSGITASRKHGLCLC